MGIDCAALYGQIGGRIREIRALRGVTQTQLAAEAGLQRTSIANIERGRQRPPLHVIYELSEALGVDVHDLLPSAVEVPRLFPDFPISAEDRDLAMQIRRKVEEEDP